MDFRARHTIQTAENIPLVLDLAGLAARVFAAGIDAILIALLAGGLLFLLWFLAMANKTPEVAKTLTPIGLMLIMSGYHPFQEWLWNGKTVGKALLGIRVVRENGQPIGFWEALGRGLLRVVDIGLGAGLPCMMLNAREKRLGDWLVGTVAVREQAILRPGIRPDSPLLKPISQRRNEEPVHAAHGVHPASRLTTAEYELLGSYLARCRQFFKPSRQRLSEDLRRYFSLRLDQPFETDADLEGLWLDCQEG